MITEYNPKRTIDDVFHAIRDMELRGAPLIGIAAGYGMYLGIKDIADTDHAAFIEKMKQKGDMLVKARPTASNLFRAIERMIGRAENLKAEPGETKKRLLEAEAIKIQREEVEINLRIGENLLTLLKDGMTILTHCNAGCLATADYGTATSPVYLAKERGWNIRVYADETRPYLQGARLTAYELAMAGIDVTLICDSMAGMVMSQGKIDAVIVGTDRVAANGDIANKIGTMSVAILARHFNIPFYIAAPSTTVDISTPTGKEIPIEERDKEEITNWYGRKIAPEGIKVFNPAFDVTPHDLITAIVTDRGIIYPPFDENIKRMF
jgi:methylthioribose-1-phosphate isomerase